MKHIAFAAAMLVCGSAVAQTWSPPAPGTMTFSAAPKTSDAPATLEKHNSVSLWNIEHSLTDEVSGNLLVGAGGALVSGNFTRPADTTAYASGDLVSNNTTAGSVTPITFTVGRGTTGASSTGMIRRVRLLTSSTSITNSQFRIHFYSTSPTVTNGDNGAWVSNQVANYLGSMDVNIDKAFSDGAQGVGVPNVGNEINFATQTIYALIEARAAYTPTSAEVFTVKLEVLRN